MVKTEWTLHNRLLNLIGICNSKEAGSLNSIELQRGLRVGIRILDTGDLRLYLSRTDVFPSFQEWGNVLKHFPLSIDAQMPKQNEYKGRFYLVGELVKKE